MINSNLADPPRNTNKTLIMSINPRVVLAQWPEAEPIPGEHLVFDDSKTIDVENIPLNGGFLTKLLQIRYRGLLTSMSLFSAYSRSPSVPSHICEPGCVIPGSGATGHP